MHDTTRSIWHVHRRTDVCADSGTRTRGMIMRDVKHSAWEQMAVHVAVRLERDARSANRKTKTSWNSSVGTIN